MVGVEDYCAVLDRVARVCVVRADDVEAEVENDSPQSHRDTEKSKTNENPVMTRIQPEFLKQKSRNKVWFSLCLCDGACPERSRRVVKWN